MTQKNTDQGFWSVFFLSSVIRQPSSVSRQPSTLLFTGIKKDTRVFLSRNDRKNRGYKGYKGYKNGKDAILW